MKSSDLQKQRKTASTRRAPARRMPTQARAQETVAAILQAVVRILKREGIASVTTNKVADVAGVSVGTVYQYFADKKAIFGALHDRHSEEMGQLIERTMVEHAAAPLDDLVRALVETLIEAHSADPGLHVLLMSEVPHGAHGAHAFEDRLRNAFRWVFAARRDELPAALDVERLLFVVPLVLDAMVHGAALRRPARLSEARAREEAVQTVLRCLKA